MTHLEKEQQALSRFPLSLQLKLEDFLPVTSEEREQLTIMRTPTTFWKDAMHRLRKNPVAMISLVVILLAFVFAFIMPVVFPYSYYDQPNTRGIADRENLAPFEYAPDELLTKASGQFVMPHIFGTDQLGRDLFVRTMYGTRVSLLVGMIAAVIVLLIGATYGSISGLAGGTVDLIMQRIVEIIYTIPDILIIIMLSVALKAPLNNLYASVPWLNGISTLGPGLISIFITFSMLYWVGMARIVRGQVLMLKQQEFVTAARALGASNGRIIRRHLLPNCMGTIIVTTTLQIPSAIFVESFLSFLGLGVAAPMPSLGSLASSAIGGFMQYPHRLLAPAAIIMFIILAFNLLGDGLRDAFDPRLKK